LFTFIKTLRKGKEVERIYDDLISVLGRTVRSEHVLTYYKTLNQNILELQEGLNRRQVLLRKMEELPEGKEHIENRNGTSD